MNKIISHESFNVYNIGNEYDKSELCKQILYKIGDEIPIVTAYSKRETYYSSFIPRIFIHRNLTTKLICSMKTRQRLCILKGIKNTKHICVIDNLSTKINSNYYESLLKDSKIFQMCILRNVKTNEVNLKEMRHFDFVTIEESIVPRIIEQWETLFPELEKPKSHKGHILIDLKSKKCYEMQMEQIKNNFYSGSKEIWKYYFDNSKHNEQ